MENADDISLIKEVRNSSVAAFNVIYSRYSEAVYYTIYKKVKNKDDVDDIFQDFFTSIWRKRASINVETSFKAWMFTSLRNHILNALLKESKLAKHAKTFENTFVTSEDLVHQELEVTDLSRHIREEINRLPSKMRMVWSLRKDHNMSISEISTHLNISEQTTKNQLSTVKKRLQDFISKLYIFSFFI